MKNFFPTSRLTQEKEKSSTDELPTRFAIEFFFVLRVAQVKNAKDFFFRQATYRARTWKLLSLPGLVLHHKKGTQERRKEKDQGRREGGSAKAKFRVSSTKNFFFWFTSIWVWKQPVSFEVSAPTRLSLQGSHVRRKFRKRTTLRSESSALIGLLYAG